MNGIATSDRFQAFQYLSFFITRSFLIAVLFFMCLITIIFGFYFIDLSIHSDSPLFGAYVIVSPSMVPTIKINDAIVIRRVDHDNYKIGDIITFTSNDSQYKGLTITHRIVDKKVEQKGEISRYTTKGDNNVIADPTPVHTNDIFGRVLFKIPKIGYIQNYLSKPTNFFKCLFIPGLLFVGYEVGRIIFMLKNQKKD